MSDSHCSRKVIMSVEQCNKWVEVNEDFWIRSNFMKILDSGVPLYLVNHRDLDDIYASIRARDDFYTSVRYCAKLEIYSHPSIVRLLKSSPELHKKTACYAVGEACESGDIVTVKEMLSGGLVDINDCCIGSWYGKTPLMHATIHNQISIVSLLLTYNHLVLDKATTQGYTALHFACDKDGTSFPTIPLLGNDRRCTPAVLNKKDHDGDSPLMWAVMFGNLQSLKELEKLDGTNFHTVNRDGEGLLDVAWRRIRKKSRKEDHEAVLEYLLNRRKIESLKELSAHAVARLLSCEVDVKELDVPLVLHPWVAGFLETSPNMIMMDRDGMTVSDDSPESSDWDTDSVDQDEDLWSNFSSNDEDNN